MSKPTELIQGVEHWFEIEACYRDAVRIGGCVAIASGSERPESCHPYDDLFQVCPYYREEWDEDFWP